MAGGSFAAHRQYLPFPSSQHGGISEAEREKRQGSSSRERKLLSIATGNKSNPTSLASPSLGRWNSGSGASVSPGLHTPVPLSASRSSTFRDSSGDYFPSEASTTDGESARVRPRPLRTMTGGGILSDVSTPLYPHPPTPTTANHYRRKSADGLSSILLPSALAAILRRPFRSTRSALLVLTLLLATCLFYLSFFHPNSSAALYHGAKAPLQSSYNKAKNLLGSIANTSPLKSSNLLSGLNSVGEHPGDLLPLSPWNRFQETWEQESEDNYLSELSEGRRDGRLLIKKGRPHPIPYLMKRAKKRWVQLQERQSKTFPEAVKEYHRRYGRAPPKGFDRWYAFARMHGVKMIDEFDIIEHSLRPFRAFDAASFRERAARATQLPFTWAIRVQNGRLTREGELAHHERAHGIVHMCEKFKHELPDMLIGYNGADGARVNLGWEERMRLEEMTMTGKKEHLDLESDSELKPKMKSPPPGWGIPQTCEPDSAMRNDSFKFGDPRKDVTGLERPTIPKGAIGTVIDSFLGYADTCNSPQYRHFHSSTSWAYQTWPTTVMPLFTPGVHARFADVYCIITEQFNNEVAENLAWEERHPALVWRGQPSGPLYESHTPWISTQRPRLHLQSHDMSDADRAIVVTDKDGLAKVKHVKSSVVNPLFFDTGLVGPPTQCVQEDGTCDKMEEVFDGFDDRLSYNQQNQFKYLLDIDGNSWSGRFRRLMLSNGAVMKATIFPEFWTDWAIPWLHFIPLQVDYSDMWDIMAFFRGGPNGQGAHDDLAKEIGAAGADFAREHMRWEDIEAFQFRQLLEYGRLWNADREDMDFRLEVEDYEPYWL